MRQGMAKLINEHRQGMFIVKLVLYAVIGIGFPTAGLACSIIAMKKRFGDVDMIYLTKYDTSVRCLIAAYVLQVASSIAYLIMDIIDYAQGVSIEGDEEGGVKHKVIKAVNGTVSLYSFAVWIYVQVVYFRHSAGLFSVTKFAYLYFIIVTYVMIGAAIIMCVVMCVLLAKAGKN